MKVWLMGLGLALLCAVHAEDWDPDSIDYVKGGGQWHVLGMATDCKKFLKHKDDMEVVRATLTKMEDGSLKVSSAIKLPNGCKKIDVVFEKGEDGKLFHECKWGKKVVDHAETDYETYGILSITLQKEGEENCKIVTLLGRGLSITPEVMEKFMAKVKEAGLTAEQMKIFPNEKVACTEISVE